MGKLLRVVSVSETGATIERVSDSHLTSVSWEDLRTAASQEDPDLRTAYAEALREAQQVALVKSPLVICYGQDDTNVWWRAWVETAWGGVLVGSTWHTLTIVAADEGGTLAHEWMALDDAKNIAARIRKIAPKHPITIEAR